VNLLFEPTIEGFTWVIAVAITIIVLDIFFSTEILSATAILGVATYFTLLFDISWQWRVLLALICWLASMALFYSLWRLFVAPAVLKVFSSGIKESVHLAEGDIGEFRSIEGKMFVLWNAELWPVESSSTEELSDREKVLIEKVEKGVFTIAQIKP
jgi:hypothetical protein